MMPGFVHQFIKACLKVNPPFHLAYWMRLRLAILLCIDFLIIVSSFFFAFFLRLDSFLPNEFAPGIFATLPYLVAIHITIFYMGGMYRQVWRYANLNCVTVIAKSLSLSTLITTVCFYLFISSPLPRSIFILYWLVAFTLLNLSRFSWRVWTSLQLKAFGKNRPACVIYGAGTAGNLLAHHINTSHNFPYRAVGFIDDDYNKKNRTAHGLRILGSGENIGRICEDLKVSTVIIALHTASGNTIRDIVTKCQNAGIKPLMMPDISTFMGQGTFQPRPIDIADLLKRSPRSIDESLVRNFFQNETVLITGAGGSIGSEIAKQVYDLNPAHIILLDSNEYNLYIIESRLSDAKKSGQVKLTPILGSVCEPRVVEHVFSTFQPTIVLHAAAYKHVSIIEKNPLEGVLNNLIGTKMVADAAIKHKVEKFLLVSTDKAVNPTSTMGASKRACELILQALAGRNPGSCKFSAVRFGNVLGSSGSVVPRFVRQIQNGGPVTVTHPDVTRYFMLTSEAVGLVLQSAAMAKGGEIFILDMGEPIKIYDMAKQLILLSGKNPGQDVEIVFTGLSPGEKLYEELIIADAERHVLHENVYLAKPNLIDSDKTIYEFNKIIEHGLSGNAASMLETMRKFVAAKKSGSRTEEAVKAVKETIHIH